MADEWSQAGFTPVRAAPRSRAPTAVQGRQLDMANTGESIQSANVNQAGKTISNRVDQGAEIADLKKRLADSEASFLKFQEAQARSQMVGGVAGEDERKVAAMVQTLEGAGRRRDREVAMRPNAGKTTLVPELLRRVPLGDIAANYMVTPSRRRVVAANDLRLETAMWIVTGAAYSGEQKRNLRAAFLPSAGDDPETLSEKEAMLDDFATYAKTRASMGLVKTDGSEVLDFAQSGGKVPLPALNTGASPSATGKRLSVEEAAKLPPGTKFLGLDGRERTRN